MVRSGKEEEEKEGYWKRREGSDLGGKARMVTKEEKEWIERGVGGEGRKDRKGRGVARSKAERRGQKGKWGTGRREKRGMFWPYYYHKSVNHPHVHFSSSFPIYSLLHQFPLSYSHLLLITLLS